MLAKTWACGLEGVSAFPVEVESFVSGGFVGFDIVGLPSAAVKESRDRVRAAISVNGYKFPFGKVTVNLAPADIRKEGTGFDLAIALSVLASHNPDAFRGLDQTVLLGELSLQGKLMPVHGALAMAICASEKGFHSLILPKENALECSCVDNLTVYPAQSIQEVVDHLTGKTTLEPVRHTSYSELASTGDVCGDLKYVKGQKIARKALEIAAAGGHNLLLVGIPGSGKTMLARCLPGILPPLSYEESIETTMIYSASGMLPAEQGLMTDRPFRSPHHSISMAAMIGGGVKAMPGEISLAHNGVLFLDELPEFQKTTLEALRQPLEDHVVSINRVSGQNRYKSQCMLVAGMNPCPCGNFGSRTRQCRCSSMEIKKYLGRISGPLLDRIDLRVEMDAVSPDEIESTEVPESSAEVRKRVCEARKLQLERFEGTGYFSNAQLDQAGLEKYCALNPAAKKIMMTAVERFGISMRGFSRIQKVARTIADLAGHDELQASDIASAVQFRNVEGSYWK